MSTEDVIRRWEKAVNGHDAIAVGSIYTKDAPISDPSYPEPLIGAEGARKDAESYLKAFPNMTARILRMASNGDFVMGEVQFHGTNSGPMETPAGVIPPTNRSLELHVAFAARVNAQGLISEERRYYDTTAFMKALGLA